MTKVILFPSSFLNPREVDEDLAEEYRAAHLAGGFKTIVFDYQAWFREQRLKLSYVPEREITAVYRGWMMKPEQYTVFFRELLSQKIRLLTTPEMYENLHLFPLVYPELLPDTARMLTFPLHSEIDVRTCQRAFGRFLVKDYVKSVKGSEFPAYFDENCSQEAFNVWMELFYRYRGDLLTGGICIKEFLELKRYEGRTNEYRVFYVNHEPICISRNSGQEGKVAEPPTELVQRYRKLGSVFYTLDYAELSDGSFTILESGDGSVSGLAKGADAANFYRKLYRALNQNQSEYGFSDESK